MVNFLFQAFKAYMSYHFRVVHFLKSEINIKKEK